MTTTTLEKVMTPLPICLDRNDCLDKVAALFKEHSFHHLPITDGSERLVGIISRTDVERLQHGATLFRIPDRESYNETLFQITRVADIMTKDVVSLSVFDSIEIAYQVFKKNAFRAIPIVEKGKLVGIVTPLDLLDFFMTKN